MHRVRIDKKAIPLRPGVNYDWTVDEGPNALLQLWELPKDRVLDLLDRKLGKEVTLELNGTMVERVVVVGNAPSGYAKTMFVIFSNVKWYWTKGILVRWMNARWPTGETRVVSPGTLDKNLAVVAPEIRYKVATIKNRKVPFTTGTLLENVLKGACTAQEGRPKIEWVIDKPTVLDVTTFPVQETYIDDKIPVAIATALGAMPGRGIIADLKGIVHVIDRTPGAEEELARAVEKGLRRQGQVVKLDRAAARPKGGWWIRYNRDVEMRTDAFLPTVDKNGFWSRNMAVLPDLETTIPGRAGSDATLARDSVLPFDDACKGWGPTKGKNAVHPAPALSDDVIRERVASPALELTYFQTNPDPADRAAWGRRLPVVRRCWRRFFQINPRAMASVESIEAILCTVYDPVTGTRAESPVFVDHSLQFSIASNLNGPPHESDGENVKSWAALSKDCKGAPFKVRIVSARQGLYMIEWAGDESGIVEEAYPWAMESLGNWGTKSDPDHRSKLFIECDAVKESNHRMSTILTMRPASPNDERRLYSCHVTTEEAIASLTWLDAKVKPKKFKGPDESLRARLTSARFAHTDDPAEQDQREAMFAADDDDSSKIAPAPITLLPVNFKDEVKPLALAMAAADLVSKLDCREGEISVPKIEWALPIGSLREVTFRVSTKRSLTRLIFERPEAFTDPLPFLPASARKRLTGEPIA